MTYGTVEELAQKLEEKPKQVLFVPQYKPLRGEGRVRALEQARAHGRPIEVQGTGKASYAVHRHDTKVGEIDETGDRAGDRGAALRGTSATDRQP
ncbi:MAG: hypothetical protein V8S24_00040 [Gordonibacter pamelaeae]